MISNLVSKNNLALIAIKRQIRESLRLFQSTYKQIRFKLWDCNQRHFQLLSNQLSLVKSVIQKINISRSYSNSDWIYFSLIFAHKIVEESISVEDRLNRMLFVIKDFWFLIDYRYRGLLFICINTKNVVNSIKSFRHYFNFRIKWRFLRIWVEVFVLVQKICLKASQKFWNEEIFNYLVDFLSVNLLVWKFSVFTQLTQSVNIQFKRSTICNHHVWS